MARSTVEEVRIVSGLKSTDVFVGEQALFSCELSRGAARDAHWWLDGTRLQQGAFANIGVTGDHVHTLVLKNLAANDSGTVTFKAGSLVSSAKLLVKGTEKQGLGPFLSIPLYLLVNTDFSSRVQHCQMSVKHTRQGSRFGFSIGWDLISPGPLNTHGTPTILVGTRHGMAFGKFRSLLELLRVCLSSSSLALRSLHTSACFQVYLRR